MNSDAEERYDNACEKLKNMRIYLNRWEGLLKIGDNSGWLGTNGEIEYQRMAKRMRLLFMIEFEALFKVKLS